VSVEFKVGAEFEDELRSKQGLLGCTDLKSTVNLLMSLGALVVDEALKGGQAAIVFEDKQAWNPIAHPALEHIKTILAER